MRALLVAAAPVTGSVVLVAELAPQHDLVIAVDGGGRICLDAHVTPDLVVGDFDSLDAAALEQLRDAGARVLPFPAEKDATDLELALAAAREAGVGELTVTAVSSGRLDHTLAAVGALTNAADLRPEIAEPDMRAWVLRADAREQVRVGRGGATVSLIAFGAGARVSISGVRWPLDGHDLSAGSGLGVSNIVNEEAGAVIRVHSGTVLAILHGALDGLNGVG